MNYQWTVALFQSKFQEVASDSCHKHHAIQVQHGIDGAGESQHPLSVPKSHQYGKVHRNVPGRR